jgi:hypothetical protein
MLKLSFNLQKEILFMFQSRVVLLIVALVTGLMLFSCEGLFESSDHTPAQDDPISETVINDEYANFSAAASDSIDADALFSISWRNVFYPSDSIETMRSHVFAVAPNQDTSSSLPDKWGYDMGAVSLNYQSATIELSKIERENGAIFYELGKRRPGGRKGRGGYKNHKNGDATTPDTTTIPYYPGGTYEFQISGSDDIAAATIQASAPAALLSINSHTKGDSIDSANDLTVSWIGGESSQTIIVALKPGFQKNADGHKGGKKGKKRGRNRDGDYTQSRDADRSFGGKGLKHRLFDEYALRYALDDNAGTFTIPAADIQQLLTDVSATALALEVKQLVTYETEENDQKYLLQFRLGDMVSLKVK